jgi:hypothetical protein
MSQFDLVNDKDVTNYLGNVHPLREATEIIKDLINGAYRVENLRKDVLIAAVRYPEGRQSELKLEER